VVLEVETQDEDSTVVEDKDDISMLTVEDAEAVVTHMNNQGGRFSYLEMFWSW
jgi:hypothetical protein